MNAKAAHIVGIRHTRDGRAKLDIELNYDARASGYEFVVRVEPGANAASLTPLNNDTEYTVAGKKRRGSR